MDPTANLAEQLRIAARINKCRDQEHNPPSSWGCECAHYAERLAELVEALDQWLKRGGLEPEQWSK